MPKGAISEHDFGYSENLASEKTPQIPGSFFSFEAKNIDTNMSFLEMLDFVNEQLVNQAQEPVAFESDCREGICGVCSLVINGIPHGPKPGTTTCQLHMRSFKNGVKLLSNPLEPRDFRLSKTW